MMLRTLVFLIVILLAGSYVGAASANTFNFITNNIVQDTSFRLTASLPYDRQVLAATPQAISLTFSQAPRTERSYIKVIDMFGAEVSSGEVAVNGPTLYTLLPDLAPGKYMVKWSVHCRCAEDIELSDMFHFTIKPE